MPRKQRNKLTQEGWDFHQHVWRHNSFMGMAKMMLTNSNTILTSTSASAEAKAIAERIIPLARQLDAALRKERIDPK